MLALLLRTLAALLWGCLAIAAAQPAQLPSALRERAAAAPASERAGLQHLYAAGSPLWLDVRGRPNEAALQALAPLAAAGEDGLVPADYEAATLAAAAVRLADSRADAAAAELAAFDVALSTSLLRFMRELHTGRLPPRQAGFGLPSREAEHDFAGLLRSALDGRRLGAAIAELRPAFAQYGSLRSALARYRVLAAQPAEALPAWPRTVRPGDAAPGLDALQRRLLGFGDLAPADATAAPVSYDAALVDAVRRFQRRHGLAADGAIGKATRAALEVSPQQRVGQLELALERLRWLPHPDGRPFIAINIPMFRLWAARPGTTPLELAVIVGRALDTRTPVFRAELKQVVFRPYWNVPRSIVRNELLAPIARDPSYLARHDMEIVRGGGDDARALPPTPANLALLRDGALRLRQRPGPRNSLGLAKFVFPNAADVYLHGTPAQQLFERTRRDFSHGCVRVEDPLALAEWVLRDEPAAWPRERIAAAMHAGQDNQAVTLARPLPVLLYYVTALVLDGGDVHFADDLYGHDARLQRALDARTAGPALDAR